MLACVATILGVGCAEPSGPVSGSIVVVVATAGSSADFDTDGYTIIIDDGTPQKVAVNTSLVGLTIDNIAPGSHVVRLDGLASNCSVSGSNQQRVEVVAESASFRVSFLVTCAVRRGSIRVTTVTSGPNPDEDGYAVFVAGRSQGNVPANGTQIVSELRVGRANVSLAGLAVNCAIEGASSQEVDISFGGTANIAFAIRCAPAGSLRVTTKTTGVNIGNGSYSLIVQRDGALPSRSVALPANGTVTAPSLSGGHTLTLRNVRPDCNSIGSNPQRITVGVDSVTSIAFEIFCAAPTQIAFVKGTGTSADIYVINSDGNGETRLTTQAGLDVDPAWSPDGRRLAFTSDRDGNREIYLMKADGTSPARLTSEPASDHSPAWSPDGSKIAFVSDRDGNPEIYVVNADGTNLIRLTSNVSYDADPAWSPDGSRIAFGRDQDGVPGLWVMKPDGSDLTRLTSDATGDRQPAWSPDGTRIAFTRGGVFNNEQVFIVNADGSRLTRLDVFFQGTSEPTWSPDGRKLALVGLEAGYYYDSPRIYVVNTETLFLLAAGGSPPVSSPAWRR